MWEDYAKPLECAEVYFGANPKVAPGRGGRRVGRLWIDMLDIGSSMLGRVDTATSPWGESVDEYS